MPSTSLTRGSWHTSCAFAPAQPSVAATAGPQRGAQLADGGGARVVGGGEGGAAERLVKSRCARPGSVDAGSSTRRRVAGSEGISGAAAERRASEARSEHAARASAGSPRQRRRYTAAASTHAVSSAAPPAVSRPHAARSGGQSTEVDASSGMR